MRPGSLERIEFYRQCALDGLPLFDDVPIDIPMLPGEDKRIGRKQMLDVGDSFDRAMELLTSDDAAAKLSKRIEQLDKELSKLKKLQKALYGVSVVRGKTTAVNPEIEKQVVQLLTSRGPMKPKDIGEALGVNYTHIGRVVNSSKKLEKDGLLVVIAS